MASADVTIVLRDLPEVQALIDASIALDELLGRSYEPTSMDLRYAAFHTAIAPFAKAQP